MSEGLAAHLNVESHEHTCDWRRYRALLRRYKALVWENAYLLRKYWSITHVHHSKMASCEKIGIFDFHFNTLFRICALPKKEGIPVTGGWYLLADNVKV